MCVHLPHIDEALHAEQSGGRGGGHAVLTRARLGDEAPLAHPPGQQGLPDHVVELVRAGVGQVLALEEQLDPQLGGEPLAPGDRRRPTPVVLEGLFELRPEPGVGPRPAEGLLELEARRHQRLGDEATAEPAEPAPAPAGVAAKASSTNPASRCENTASPAATRRTASASSAVEIVLVT